MLILLVGCYEGLEYCGIGARLWVDAFVDYEGFQGHIGYNLSTELRIELRGIVVQSKIDQVFDRLFAVKVW